MPNPRLPTAVKALRGTLQRARENPDEPQMEAIQVPGPGPHLGDLERRIWDRLKPMVDSLGVMTEADLEAFEVLVQARAEYERLRQDDPDNLREIREARKDVRTMLQEFGLTPASRPRVKALAGRKGTNDLDEFFRN